MASIESGAFVSLFCLPVRAPPQHHMNAVGETSDGSGAGGQLYADGDMGAFISDGRLEQGCWDHAYFTLKKFSSLTAFQRLVLSVTDDFLQNGIYGKIGVFAK